MSNNIVRGTMLLTGASFLSRFLGMIYVIPFNALVGSQGGALYFYAYNPYSILISISTVGVPLAVSKFVAKYNSLGDYETGMRMFRTGLMMMLLTGLRSEEHTSELQSRGQLVCRLLLEKTIKSY